MNSNNAVNLKSFLHHIKTFSNNGTPYLLAVIETDDGMFTIELHSHPNNNGARFVLCAKRGQIRKFIRLNGVYKFMIKHGISEFKVELCDKNPLFWRV